MGKRLCLNGRVVAVCGFQNRVAKVPSSTSVACAPPTVGHRGNGDGAGGWPVAHV